MSLGLDVITLSKALNVIQNRPMRPLTANTGTIAATANTFYTVLNVTGSGWLTVLGAFTSLANGAFSLSWRVTIDGNPATVISWSNGTMGGMPYDDGAGVIVKGYAYLPLTPGVRFKSSLLVEVSSAGAASINGQATYVLL